MRDKIKIGIVQSGASHLNLAESLEKALTFMEEAARADVELLVFGETWLSGYPVWLDYAPAVAQWDHPPTKKLFARMHQHSVAINGAEIKTLQEKAQAHQMAICLGMNEKVNQGPGNGTIYNALLIMGADGEILNHHRKLMPTYTEKMLYGLGDGAGLQAVDLGGLRIGGLICWEHWMPLTRQALHDSGEHIHIALWPKVHEMHQIACRQYAFEGRCFVVGVGQLFQIKDFPQELEPPDELKNQPEHYLLDGNSCIVAPNGAYELAPQKEISGLIIHEITDLSRCYEERATLDVSGHYQRRDVFDFQINKERIN